MIVPGALPPSNRLITKGTARRYSMPLSEKNGRVIIRARLPIKYGPLHGYAEAPAMGKRLTDDPGSDGSMVCTICGTHLVDDQTFVDVDYEMRAAGKINEDRSGRRFVCSYCWGLLLGEIRTMRAMVRRFDRRRARRIAAGIRTLGDVRGADGCRGSRAAIRPRCASMAGGTGTPDASARCLSTVRRAFNRPRRSRTCPAARTRGWRRDRWGRRT